MAWYETVALGDNGKTGAASTATSSGPQWQTVTDEHGTYQTSSGETLTSQELRIRASMHVAELNALVRAAETGSAEQRAAGRRRIMEYLSHPDTVRSLRGWQSAPATTPADAQRAVLDAYARAQAVAEGRPSWTASRWLVWGGAAAAGLALIGIVAVIATRGGRS